MKDNQQDNDSLQATSGVGAQSLPWPVTLEMVADSLYQLLFPLTPEEYQGLKQQIEEDGVEDPVIFDDEGHILDGHNRLRACLELGRTDFPWRIKCGLTDQDKRNYVRRRNCRRRHLSQEQKRTLCATQVMETPHLSHRQIGDIVGVDHKTAKSVRTELEQAGKIEVVEKLEGKSGAKRSASRTLEPTQPRATEPCAPPPTVPPVPGRLEDDRSDHHCDDDSDEEAEVAEFDRGTVRLLSGPLVMVARMIEHGSVRAIICDNPLRPSKRRKGKPTSHRSLSNDIVGHYQDVASFASDILPLHGVLLLPVETPALADVLAAVTLYVPYCTALYHVYHDASFSGGRHTTGCDPVLVLSPGKPQHNIKDYETEPHPTWEEQPGNCDLDYLFTDDEDTVLFINPNSLDVRSTVEAGRKVVAVYETGTDLEMKMLEIDGATTVVDGSDVAT
jgi:hypothetical protein